jgi:CubicO group peptidase (beta-lactamase class C family)
MRRKGEHLLRLFATSLAITLAGVICVGAAFPHVLILLREGYPAQKWPSGGDFVEVEGDVTGKVMPRFKVADGRLGSTADSEALALLLGQGPNDILDLYPHELSPETRFNSFSLVKGLMGVLALRAVDEGVFKSLDATIGEMEPPLEGLPIASVTLRELIDMRSGISFEANGLKGVSGGDASGEKPVEAVPYNPFGPLARLHALGIERMLGEFKVSPMRRGQFEYQNANTAIVGYLLEKAYRRPLATILSEMIWKPAGAMTAHWRSYPDKGMPSAYCCLFATASDWRKVADYLLQNGTADSPLLSEPMWHYWVGADISADLRRKGVYRSFARYDVLDRPGEPVQGPFLYFLGQNGQIVYFLPSRNAVAVRFGNGMYLLHTGLYEMARHL